VHIIPSTHCSTSQFPGVLVGHDIDAIQQHDTGKQWKQLSTQLAVFNTWQRYHLRSTVIRL